MMKVTTPFQRMKILKKGRLFDELLISDNLVVTIVLLTSLTSSLEGWGAREPFLEGGSCQNSLSRRFCIWYFFLTVYGNEMPSFIITKQYKVRKKSKAVVWRSCEGLKFFNCTLFSALMFIDLYI